MAYPPANPRGPVEVIDLTSDGPEAEIPVMAPRQPMANMNDDYMALYQTPPPQSPQGAMRQGELDKAFFGNQQAEGGEYIEIDGEYVFIPDEVNEPARGAAGLPAVDVNVLRDHEIAMGLQQPEQPPANFQADNMVPDENVARDREVAMALENEDVTADTCLQRVLEIFPDISHGYVTNLFEEFGKENDYETLPGQARLDNIIEQLAEATSYPKQEKGKRKRKREPSIDETDTKKWERQDRVAVTHYLNPQMRSMLKADFPDIPVQYIKETLDTNVHFYQSYLALDKARDDSLKGDGRLLKGRPSPNLADASTIAMNTGNNQLLDELNAARSKIESDQREEAVENAKNRAEKDNLERAIMAGETSECSACFDEYPMNRQIHCNGPIAHFTCYECALTYIKSEVGESRCRVLCTAGCGAAFAKDQLNQLSDRQLLEKLAQLEQERDLRDAGLDDLEECPFCDYKEIPPPIEEDFEFRCKNSDCEQVSCRRCKSVSHIPISCEQHAKDSKGSSRKKIEEAMTAAMIRSCAKCKKQFIKDFGCNKMRCPSCGNLQCYVCSQTIKDYNHFDQGPSGNTQGGSDKCPLYDNVEERHAKEVKDAEATAREEVLRENPDLSAADLEIKVSDAVKRADADRLRQGGPPGGANLHDQIFQLHQLQAQQQQQAQQLQNRQAMADRARHQQLRRDAAQIRRAAREAIAGDADAAQLRRDLEVGIYDPFLHHGVFRAEQEQRLGRFGQYNAMPAANDRQPAQAPQANQQGGILGAVQGYIPVLWNPPAPVVQPQVQQRAAAAAPAPPQRQQAQQAQPRQGLFGGQAGRFNLGVGNLFDFGGDGAADLDAAQLQHFLIPNNNNNNNNNNSAVPALPAAQNIVAPEMPGAWPNRAQANPPNAAHRQMQALELENLRMEHDRRVIRRQQIQQQMDRINNQPNNRLVDPHYEEYEQEMRRRNGYNPR